MVNNNVQTKKIIGLIIMGFIILVLPHLIQIRNNNNNLLDEESYFNLNVAQKIFQNDFNYEKLDNNNFFIIEDNSVYHGRDIIINPYQMIISFNSNELFSRIVPIVFGLISLLLIYLLLNKLNINFQIINLTLIFIILSPIFVSTFSLSNKYSMIILLILLGYYFFLNDKWYGILISCISFSIVTLFGNFEAMLSLVLLFGYVTFNKDKKFKFLFVFFSILMVLFLFNFLVTSNVNKSIEPDFVKDNFFNEIITDFGSTAGLGLFKFLISIIGFGILWNRRNENVFVLSTLGIIIFSVLLYEKSNIIYTSFFLSYVSALGLNYFIEKKWHVDFLKYLTIITIFSGLLFSSISYVMVVTRNTYSHDETESLIWLKENREEGLILSHYSNGIFINFHSEMPVFMDSYFKNNKNINEYYRISENIFHSINLLDAVKMLDSLNIKYLWINNRMKEGLIWDEQTGLLFLLRNRDYFEKIYENEDVMIYEYKDGLN